MNKETRIVLVLGMALLAIAAATIPPPPEATIDQVNAGTARNLYVSPYGLANWSGAGGGSPNAITAASAAASSGLLWTSGGANRTAVATDTITSLNVTNLAPTAINGASADGQIFVGAAGSGNFTKTTITAGTNVSITNGANSITIAATGNVTTTGSQTLENKDIQLSGSLGTDDTYTGTTISGLNAGATIAQWDAVYVGGSSTHLLADANGTGTYPAVGVAVAAYTNGNAAKIIVRGTVRNDAWNWTPGGRLYLSTTAGGLTQTAPTSSGDKVQDVGVALTADIAYLDFNGVYLTVQ